MEEGKSDFFLVAFEKKPTRKPSFNSHSHFLKADELNLVKFSALGNYIRL